MNPDNPQPVQQMSKLDDLAIKVTKSNGTTPHYIVAHQALKDDLFEFLANKFDSMQNKIASLKNEIEKSRKRENDLEEQIKNLKQKNIQAGGIPDKNEIYLVGSSILREVPEDDILKGSVKSISGGKIADIKENMNSLEITPKVIISQCGGNDLDKENSSVEETVTNYTLALTEMKTKMPNTKLIISGLPPRHSNMEIRMKVKDYNEEMKQWCDTNDMTFINNEEMFEYKSGDVYTESYVMTGHTPAVHLTRKATVRMLENIKKLFLN